MNDDAGVSGGQSPDWFREAFLSTRSWLNLSSFHWMTRPGTAASIVFSNQALFDAHVMNWSNYPAKENELMIDRWYKSNLIPWGLFSLSRPRITYSWDEYESIFTMNMGDCICKKKILQNIRGKTCPCIMDKRRCKRTKQTVGAILLS